MKKIILLILSFLIISGCTRSSRNNSFSFGLGDKCTIYKVDTEGTIISVASDDPQNAFNAFELFATELSKIYADYLKHYPIK